MPKSKNAYILLFRGVGGATQLPTAPLREALTAAGFENVATYINSGNAVLRSALSREKVIASVAKICEEKFEFTKAIYAPTLAEWEVLIENNPFPEYKVGKLLHAAVLAGDPSKEAIDTLRTLAVNGESIETVGKVAYLYTPNGFGTSKLAEKFDKGIGVANTARNWNTVLKLLELAKKASGA
ncbi:DUF1697 domain-containing protein [soil metagenome]